MILIRMMKPERISKDDTLQLKKAIINIQLYLKSFEKKVWLMLKRFLLKVSVRGFRRR